MRIASPRRRPGQRRKRDIPVTIYVTVWIDAEDVAEMGKNDAAAEAAQAIEGACRRDDIEVVAEPMEYDV